MCHPAKHAAAAAATAAAIVANAPPRTVHVGGVSYQVRAEGGGVYRVVGRFGKPVQVLVEAGVAELCDCGHEGCAHLGIVETALDIAEREHARVAPRAA